MNYKHNAGFFTKTDTPKYMGIALVILGAVILYFGRGYLMYLIMCVSFPVGIVLFIFGSSRRSSEADLDTAVSVAMRGLDPKLGEDRKYAKKLHRKLAPFTAEGHLYRDGVMLAKGKDGTLRSSEYTAAVIYTLTDSLYISSRTISLTEQKTEDKVTVLSLDDIEEIGITRSELPLSFGGKSFTAHVCELSFSLTDGRSILLPVKDSVASDEYAGEMSIMLKKYKSGH